MPIERLNEELLTRFRSKKAALAEGKPPCTDVPNDFLARKEIERHVRKVMTAAVEEGKDREYLYPICVIGDYAGIIEDPVGKSGPAFTDKEVQLDHLLCAYHRLIWTTIRDMGLLAYVQMNKDRGSVYICARVIDRDDPEQMKEIGEDHSGLTT